MKVLITESRDFSKEAVAKLEEAGCQVDKMQCNYEKLLGCVHKYDGLIVRLGIKIDKKIIERGKNLKFIATLTTGLDHIDTPTAEDKGLMIMSLQGETDFLQSITSTAELAVALMLSLGRCIKPASESVLRGEWDRDKWIGQSMNGKAVGIVGMGRLGTITARLVRAFGCDVYYYDPYKKVGKYQKTATLTELAQTVDILSIHVPLNDETSGMIGAEYFGQAKREQLLINTSRGAVVDETALLKAIKTNAIAGAGLDVLRDELEGDLLSNALIGYARRHNNLLITPHIGGATFDAMRKVENYMVAKLLNSL